MEYFRCVVENPMGIHARPAAQIAQLCVGLKSMVTIECNNKTANCLNITVDGPNEVEDAKTLKKAICDTDFIDEEEVKILKIAFFNTKDYDRLFFSKLEAEKGPGTYNVDIKYLEIFLSPEYIITLINECISFWEKLAENFTNLCFCYNCTGFFLKGPSLLFF